MGSNNWNSPQKRQYSSTRLAIIATLCVVIGMFFNFIVHELSHLTTLLLVGGTVDSISVGISSLVSGYVEKDAISLVAISSIVIPLAAAYAIFKFNFPILNLFGMGFIIPNVINCAFGLFAAFFINGVTRQTYDVALAYDYTQYPLVILATTIVALVINIPLLVIEMMRIVESSDQIIIVSKKTSRQSKFKQSKNNHMMSWAKSTQAFKKISDLQWSLFLSIAKRIFHIN